MIDVVAAGSMHALDVDVDLHICIRRMRAMLEDVERVGVAPGRCSAAAVFDYRRLRLVVVVKMTRLWVDRQCPVLALKRQHAVSVPIVDRPAT